MFRSREYLPATHGVHVLTSLAPTEAEYLPATQGVHVLTSTAPTEAEYLPASHGVQWVAEVLYVPASHALHSFVPAYPAIHAQAVIPMLAAGDVEFGGHGEHISFADCTKNTLARVVQTLVHHSKAAILDAGDNPFQDTCAFTMSEPTVILIINLGDVVLFHNKTPLPGCL